MTTRLWIVDGHNVIFALPDLHRLQIADQRDAARRDLVDRLRRFSAERHEKVLVVFDGGAMLSNPEAVEEPLLEVVFARQGEGEADDRILHEARRRLEEGLLVTVVTRDLRTLAWDLPKGVRHLEVREFWRRHMKPPEKAAAKRVAGDFSDVEDTMAALAAVAEPESRERPIPRSAPQPAQPVVDPVLLKREKGRLRQERRLRRHPKRRPHH